MIDLKQQHPRGLSLGSLVLPYGGWQIAPGSARREVPRQLRQAPHSAALRLAEWRCLPDLVSLERSLVRRVMRPDYLLTVLVLHANLRSNLDRRAGH